MRETDNKSQNILKTSKVFAKFPEVLVILLILALLIIILFPAFCREMAYKSMTCGSNLSQLGKALTLYADEHGVYPHPDGWCDSLLKGDYVSEKMFKCSCNKKARCGFSINPNCEPNSEPNTVLVFESKGGWNSYGGPELFTADHHTGYGGNMLFNDGHVVFTKADSNGRPYEGLNWGEKRKSSDLK
jgi:prepilin-type processing-associated H-X9-DG protein